MDFSKGISLEDSKAEIPIDNHFKLYAGPGAGKTRFLVHHINRILNKSSKLKKSKKILCITYTNIGVETLQSRQKESAEDVEISTIHTFLYKHIIKPYLWMLEDCPFPIEKLDGHEEIILRRSHLREYVKQTNQNHIRDSDFSSLSTALNKLVWILKDDVNVELDFLKPYHGKVNKYFVRKETYMDHKNICWKNGLLSHDDVLYFSYEILKEIPQVKDVIRAKFPYILIDEFQDTNPLQAEIIRLLVEEESILGIIGDPYQAIYSFQGTDERMFNKFSLDKMILYFLKNNHRSTEEILKVLNHLRNENNFLQESPECKQGDQPLIIIGNKIQSYQYANKKIKSDKLYTLAFRNEKVKEIEFDITSESKEELDLLYSDGERGWMIHFVIESIEYGRQMRFPQAIKNMIKAYRKVDGFNEKEALTNLKRLLNVYTNFLKLSLTEFYNNYIYSFFEVKSQIMRGKVKERYDSVRYNEMAATVKITDETSMFKTVHKAKGDEFNNVLVLLPNKNQEQIMKILLNPDMSKEENRVYYVAFSRAERKLLINVPSLSDENKRKLKEVGYDVKYIKK